MRPGYYRFMMHAQGSLGPSSAVAVIYHSSYPAQVSSASLSSKTWKWSAGNRHNCMACIGPKRAQVGRLGRDSSVHVSPSLFAVGTERWHLGVPDRLAGEFSHDFEHVQNESYHIQEYRIYWGADNFTADYPNGVDLARASCTFPSRPSACGVRGARSLVSSFVQNYCC